MIWIKFAVYCFLVVLTGWKLSDYAEKLAEARNLGRGLVGVVLLGFATSLPELITTVSSVLFVDNPELGAGNILGSNNANMFILFISLVTVSTLLKKERATLDRENILNISMLYLLLGVFLAGSNFSGAPLIFGKSPYGLVIIAVFFLSIRALKRVSSEEMEHEQQREKKDLPFLFYVMLSLYLVALVFVSYQLSVVVDQIAALHPEWGSTAVGALFLAWATSLPELVVTVSAMIIGSSEMGIGNITGSNIFNMMILGVADLFAKPGQTLFKNNENIYFLSAMLLVFNGVLLYMMLSRRVRKIFGISLLPVIMMVLYIAGMVVMFMR